MIPYKWPVATAIPQNPVVRREIARAMQAFLEDGDEQLRQRRAEIAAIRQGLAEIAQGIAKFRRDARSLILSELRKCGYNPEEPRVRFRHDAPALILSELRKYGYNPEEPRVPKRHTGGGEWTRLAADANPQVLSDAAPDNPWVPGSQYATNDVNDDKTNDNLTAEQVCNKRMQTVSQASAEIHRLVRKNI